MSKQANKNPIDSRAKQDILQKTTMSFIECPGIITAHCGLNLVDHAGSFGFVPKETGIFDFKIKKIGIV